MQWLRKNSAQLWAPEKVGATPPVLILSFLVSGLFRLHERLRHRSIDPTSVHCTLHKVLI